MYLFEIICYRCFFIILFVITSLIAINLSLPTDIDMNSSSNPPLGCHRRLYTIKVTQADSKGHECWDNVSVMSCWGRCDSNEISDWKFPYKRSHHPVCIHSARTKTIAYLRNCHPEAEAEAKRYEYLEAKTCNCQTCSSTDTSCEAPNLTHDAVKVQQLGGPGPDDFEY